MQRSVKQVSIFFLSSELKRSYDLLMASREQFPTGMPDLSAGRDRIRLVVQLGDFVITPNDGLGYLFFFPGDSSCDAFLCVILQFNTLSISRILFLGWLDLMKLGPIFKFLLYFWGMLILVGSSLLDFYFTRVLLDAVWRCILVITSVVVKVNEEAILIIESRLLYGL